MILEITDLHYQPAASLAKNKACIVVMNDASLGANVGPVLTIKSIEASTYDYGNGNEDITVIELSDGAHTYYLHH